MRVGTPPTLVLASATAIQRGATTGLLIAIILDGVLWGSGVSYRVVSAAAATEFAIFAYVLYWSEMLPGFERTAVRPEPVTWALFGFTTMVASLVQFAEGSGIFGASCLFVTALGCFWIAVLAYNVSDQTWNFKWFHFITILLVALAIFFYVRLTLSPDGKHDALASACFATVGDLVAYWPAIHKAWQTPFEESPRNAFLNGVKFVPAFFALPERRPSAYVFIVVIGSFNMLFACLIYVWRRGVTHRRQNER